MKMGRRCGQLTRKVTSKRTVRHSVSVFEEHHLHLENTDLSHREIPLEPRGKKAELKEEQHYMLAMIESLWDSPILKMGVKMVHRVQKIVSTKLGHVAAVIETYSLCVPMSSLDTALYSSLNCIDINKKYSGLYIAALHILDSIHNTVSQQQYTGLHPGAHVNITKQPCMNHHYMKREGDNPDTYSRAKAEHESLRCFMITLMKLKTPRLFWH